jgi:hypothetical protein
VPNPAGGPTNNPGSDTSYWDRQRDRRLQELEKLARERGDKEKAKDKDAAKLARPVRPAGGAAGPIVPRLPQPAMQGGAYQVRFGGGKVLKSTADDEAADGIGDEIYVCLLIGYYDKEQEFFAFLPPIKSRPLSHLTSGSPIAEGIIAEEPLSVYLQPGRHVLLVCPTIWEIDAENDEAQDRECRLHDLMIGCADQVHRKLDGLKEKANGIKQAPDLAFPRIGGSHGGNRPIGIQKTARGELAYSPQALLLDYLEAKELANGKGVQRMRFLDDKDSGLGGSYELDINVGWSR